MNRARIEHRLRSAWARRGPLAWALWPLALLHRALLAARGALYATGLLRSERLGVPVIVIGNVIAGGAGKTPTALALVQHLQARGWQPGIVSRGHGRRTRDCRAVQPDDDARDVGDEPLWLRRRSGVPVFVAARRADAGRALRAAHPQVNVIVCDDGLQHRALARDVEICVFDARGIGNGWLLPAGPLREPWPRAVDLVLCTESPAGRPPPLGEQPGGGEPGGEVARPPPIRTVPPLERAPNTFHAQRSLAPDAVTANGRLVPLVDLRDQPVTALAGIARPEAFFAMLQAQGFALARTLALPDHDDFSGLDAALLQGQRLLCTEKDAVKLWRLAPHAIAVPLRLSIPSTFFAALDAVLARAAAGYHSATAGANMAPPDPPDSA